MMAATDLAPRQLAVDMDLQILAEEMMMRIATGQARNPAVVMAQVATMTTTMVRPRSPAAAMVPLAMMTTTMAQRRSLAAAMVLLATMTTTMAQRRSLAAAMVPLATMMTIMDRGPRHLAVVTDLRPPAVEMMMATAMAPTRSLVADMAVETTTMTATALETNPAAAVMAPETLVHLNIRQVIHLAATIEMTRAVSRRNSDSHYYRRIMLMSNVQ